MMPLKMTKDIIVVETVAKDMQLKLAEVITVTISLLINKLNNNIEGMEDEEHNRTDGGKHLIIVIKKTNYVLKILKIMVQTS